MTAEENGGPPGGARRRMRMVRFGAEGAWVEQVAELGPDGWHRWPDARPGPRHRVELREGALVLPLAAHIDEARLLAPARLRARGQLLLVDHEPCGRCEVLDRVVIDGDRLEHRPGRRLIQTSGQDWDCAHVFVDAPGGLDEEPSIALAAQAERSEVALPPWRPEAGRWEAVPPRDLGPLLLRSGEPLWIGVGPPRRRFGETRWVWRSESGLHPQREAIDPELPPGRPVELIVDGRRRSEQRVGPAHAFVLERMTTVDVEARTEAGDEAELVHHRLLVHNRGETAFGFDWRVPLERDGAVVVLDRDAEFDGEGLRVPVWAPPGRVVDVGFSTRRAAGALLPWMPTQS